MATIPQRSNIENLELLARQTVEGFIIGLHKSPFHGFSVEFAEHRLYNQGDNLKYVDWKVYGRNDKMFVKKFEEETNLRCCIAIDTSASMYFPEEGTNKLQYAAVSAACIAYLLKKQLDATGIALFNDDLQHLTPIRSGQRHYNMLISELQKLVTEPNSGASTNATAALHQIAERIHQRSLVIIFSDMPDDAEKESDLLSALQHLRYNKHEVILFHLMDGNMEVNFEFDNRPYEFVDMETREVLKINPMDIKEEYLSKVKAYRKKLAEHCLQYRIDLVPCDLSEPVEAILHRYLLKRNKMM